MFEMMTEQEIFTLIGFGIITNFLFSFLFGIYMSKNIGIDEMVRSTGEKKQPSWMGLILFIPFAKMIITLYRVSILQFAFLNQGKTHKDYWMYLTH